MVLRRRRGADGELSLMTWIFEIRIGVCVIWVVMVAVAIGRWKMRRGGCDR
ncbi:MAG: hypothetical protein RIR25_483 [Verrucomicrobiota bacterium]|jgi:hypothetical protein